MFYEGLKGQYGLLKDGTIVRIYTWTDPYFDEEFDKEIQDIYFEYGFFDRVRFRKPSAFAFNIDFLAFSTKKRRLRRIRRELFN